MRMTRKYAIVGGSILAISAAGTGVALAVDGGDDDVQATGPGAERAKAAALEIAGGGTVDGVEQEGEGGATWEVEVTKQDGQAVEIALDEQYRELGVESESEDVSGENGSEDESGSAEDD